MFANLIITSVLCLHMAGITTNELNQAFSSGGLTLGGTVNTSQSNSLNGYGNPQAVQQSWANAGPVKLNVTNAPGVGSGGAGGDAGARAAGYSDQAAMDLARALEAQQGDTNRLIDEAYGASGNYLNQAEGALRNDFPTVLSDIEGQYTTNIKQADTGKASTLGTIGEQQLMAEQRNQNVMADARRLYDELSRGYNQRFGGASSAGQAASEIANVERQRQQGKIQQDFGNTMRQVEQARTQVETKYQDQLAQLKQVKDTAVNEANRDFQNKLLQISQSRAENEQAKAQARLSALQDLRNKVYQINLQNLQFQQTLEAQKQQATSSLADYTNTLGGYGENAQTATGAFTPEVSSGLQTSSNTTGSGTPLVGNILQSARTKFDELFGGQSSW